MQGVQSIPNELKMLYKTVWEIPQKTILKMAADRGAFIDQSQSLNVHMAKPTTEKLTSMHFYGWQMVIPTNWINVTFFILYLDHNVRYKKYFVIFRV